VIHVNEMPDPVIRRLAQYLEFAQNEREAGSEWVSSVQIADALGLTPSTVRQDVSHLAISGTIGRTRGYRTDELEEVLAKELGMERETNVAIVGAGDLGRALARHGGFLRRRFKVCALFDNNPRLIGQKVGPVSVRSMKQMAEIITKERVELGVVAVPEGAAQQVTDLLIGARIKGILNLTLVHLAVPKDVTVVDARLVASLQELLCRKRMRETQRASTAKQRRRSKCEA
jgi:redox-sensing transcriptional repressor